MFANDLAPLSSRTVRFISGVHFPQGVRNTAGASSSQLSLPAPLRREVHA
jgi:hypothetical protein